jgi:response regulator RpfG family c-di-GMP phosphodiesterase
LLKKHGLKLLRQLRDAGDDLPVLMLTARADGVDRIIGLEQGADDYLAKPFLPRELIARIEAIMRRRRLSPAGAPRPWHTGAAHVHAYILLLSSALLNDPSTVTKQCKSSTEMFIMHQACKADAFMVCTVLCSDEEAGAAAPAGAGKRSARGAAVSRVMREKGMSLAEASRYIKEHGY